MGALGSPVRAVLLDWGGTLARELPPSGEGGAEEALRALHGRYTLALATNAASLREALERAGLDRYVDATFAAGDLGAAKPEPRFFHMALAALGVEPQEAAMVGDSYGSDVVGAKGAGLRAIWYNPAGMPCPFAHPIHDGEVQTLGDLPDVLGRSFLPDVAEALGLLREHAVPENIVRHSLAVAAAAHHLARRLRERGVAVDPLLAHRGALLHDLDKASSAVPADHGVRAGQILRDLGAARLAAIAERHVLGATPVTWEEKLVHYADKVVEGDEVVGLVARVTALSCRYTAQGAEIAQALPGLLALEEEIAAAAGVAPGDLLDELGQLDPALPPLSGWGETPYDRGEEGT
ncbi:MAG: HAD-IA family hydrolase [Candidatus Acetothermia bacterium]|nr:HAD-IA family hydrolase [Candidatus Acetothermia bacterium]